MGRGKKGHKKTPAMGRGNFVPQGLWIGNQPNLPEVEAIRKAA